MTYKDCLECNLSSFLFWGFVTTLPGNALYGRNKKRAIYFKYAMNVLLLQAMNFLMIASDLHKK